MHALLTIMSKVGSAVFDNLPLIFAVGVAIGMAKKEKEVSALSAVIAYFVMHTAINAMLQITGKILADGSVSADVLSGTVSMVSGILSLQMGVFGGIIVGLGVATLHNRFYKIQLPNSLSFFGGTRFVPIIYGPQVAVIKSHLEDYLEVAEDEDVSEDKDVPRDKYASKDKDVPVDKNVSKNKEGSLGKDVLKDKEVSENNGMAKDTNQSESSDASVEKNQGDVMQGKLIKTVTISSPMTGVAADISTAPDEAFAQRMMGDGAAVTPTDPYVYAPEDGEVGFIFDTKHAIGFLTDSDVSLLIHVGIDTVNLKGQGFEALVEVGETVKKGTKLMKLDLDYLRKNAPSITTPVLCTEPEENQKIRLLKDGEIKAGEALLAIDFYE